MKATQNQLGLMTNTLPLALKYLREDLNVTKLTLRPTKGSALYLSDESGIVQDLNINFDPVMGFATLVNKSWDIEKIRLELEIAKNIFKKHNWPVIDVTRKAVEETAASVIKIYDIIHSR